MKHEQLLQTSPHLHLYTAKNMLPEYIKGGIHRDERGTLRFCNDFDLSAVKRFYTIVNRAEQPVRGWIGHRKENKWFFPVRGETTIVVSPMGESTNLTRYSRLHYTLHADSPAVLKVPCNNWFYIEQHDGAEVMVFSDCKVGEYENDDLRRPL